MAATEQYFNPVMTFVDPTGAGVSAGDATITVTDGSVFPVPGLPFRLVVDSEFMMCTGVAGNVLSVTRGIEGTLASAHSPGTGVQNVITAGALAALFVAQ